MSLTDTSSPPGDIRSHSIPFLLISAQGQNYNTSIWHLAFAGIDNPVLVQQAYDEYTAVRGRPLCLVVSCVTSHSTLLLLFRPAKPVPSASC